jgi:hypothetical protein
MFWAVQRGSASAVVSTGTAVSRAADSSADAVWIGGEPEGLEERTASTVPATKIAITPTAITQVSCRRVIHCGYECYASEGSGPPPFRKRSGFTPGNNQPLASVNKLVRRSATLIGIALLGLIGCEGGNEATSVERNTTTLVAPGPAPQNVLTREERVSQWITACEVREILFTATHENVVYLRFRDGDRRRVRLGDEATADKVFATAYEQTCPDFKIIVAIE